MWNYRVRYNGIGYSVSSQEVFFMFFKDVFKLHVQLGNLAVDLGLQAENAILVVV
jgi:hypothetical protein